ncbi:MAG: rRNA pseudouridine synthase [Prevotellaceae bacterium]|jgi:23S rRNA pseudouridine2605 synthase|nr:rRNA pseudouridine synthase [Prevotellaceae bacterium]
MVKDREFSSENSNRNRRTKSSGIWEIRNFDDSEDDTNEKPQKTASAYEKKPRGNSYNSDESKKKSRQNFSDDRKSGFQNRFSGKTRGNSYNSDESKKRSRQGFSDDRKSGFEDRFSKKPRGNSYNSENNKWKNRDFDSENSENGFENDRPKRVFRKSESPRFNVSKKNKDGLVRLNKFIANSGVCSRREADEYIAAGVITVNGTVVTEMGVKIKPEDEVRFNNERLKGERKVYVLLNKPKNYITTVDDPHAKQTVMELVAGACKERIYPVGRLDRNSTGVLLFTNDGDLAKQLTHPSHNKMKIYNIRLDKNIAKQDVETLLTGIELEDGVAIADDVYVSDDNKAELGIEIHSGKNRVIRRMFEYLGYEVVKLDRVYFAGLTKKGLQRGQYRILTPKEISILKMGAYE